MPALLERMNGLPETSSLAESNVPRARKRRPDASVDLAEIEHAVRTILAAVGEDPDREGLLETPRRVAKMYAERGHGRDQRRALLHEHSRRPQARQSNGDQRRARSIQNQSGQSR